MTASIRFTIQHAPGQRELRPIHWDRSGRVSRLDDSASTSGYLRRVLAEWIPHYNGERPHFRLGSRDCRINRLAGSTSTGPQPVTCASRRLPALDSAAYTTITDWKASPS